MSQRSNKKSGKSSGLRTDPCWKYGTEIPVEGKSYKYIECNFCKQIVTGGVARMKEHIAGSHVGVRECPNAPEEVRTEMQSYLKMKDSAKKKKQQEFDDKVDSGSYYGGSSHTSVSSRVRGPMDRFVARDGDENAQSTPMQPTQQVMPPNAKEARRLVCLDIGRFFFENGLPFNPIESPSFSSMCRSIAEYGPGLKTPSRHELCTWILNEEVTTTEVRVNDIRKTWTQTGVSILSDGWKDMRGRSLINFLVNNPHGTIFLRSIDASDVVKDANKLFELLDAIVDEVGEDLVLQVVTDNASNYKAAGKLLMKKRKRLYWTPCAAHCIDLMLEKIGELPQHKHALRNARKVSNFIYNHGYVLALMRKFTQRELIRPATTRFATAFLTLESMVQSKQPLEAMFTSADWANSAWAKKKDGKAIKKIIVNDKNFWPSVSYALNTTRPLVKVLRMVDGERMPAMGFIYGAMDSAKEEIKKNMGDELGRYKDIWDIIDAKWDFQMHRDIHAAAYSVNPRYRYSDDFSTHYEVKRGLMACMEKLIPPEDLAKADLQLDKFRDKEGLFGLRQARDTYQTRTPANWWIQFGDETPELQSFAVRVLSLTCSASACERNWSTFNQVHTKKRNRLDTKKLNALVYVMYNRRLKARELKLQKDDVDPLVLDHLPSDDEWCVSDEENPSDERDDGPMTDEQFNALLDSVPRSTGETSRSRKRQKKSTISRGQSKKAYTVIDEEEIEIEDEDEDEEEEEEEDEDVHVHEDEDEDEDEDKDVDDEEEEDE